MPLKIPKIPHHLSADGCEYLTIANLLQSASLHPPLSRVASDYSAHQVFCVRRFQRWIFPKRYEIRNTTFPCNTAISTPRWFSATFVPTDNFSAIFMFHNIIYCTRGYEIFFVTLHRFYGLNLPETSQKHIKKHIKNTSHTRKFLKPQYYEL